MSEHEGITAEEIRYWEDLLARLGAPGITVRDVVKTEDGYVITALARGPDR